MSTRKLALLALLTALVAAATRVIQIPTPATKGYVNLGDGMIFVAALLFGGSIGGIAGGIGSALADILGGYANWALPTLIIKGLEGLLVGWLFQLTRRNMAQKAVPSSVRAGHFHPCSHSSDQSRGHEVLLGLRGTRYARYR